MSSETDFDEMDTEFQELLETEEAPPEAFYLALKQALVQLAQHSPVTSP